MNKPEQRQHIKTRRTINGFIIEIDPASWSQHSQQGIRRRSMLAFLHSRRAAHDLAAGKTASKEVSS
jgi:hypothetical protein